MKTALVTGASRGIGKSIAQELLNDGFHVIGTSRSGLFSSDLHNHPHFTSLAADFSDVQHGLDSILSYLAQHECPDVLINNAGISVPSSFLDKESQWKSVWDETIHINLTVPAVLTKWFLERWTKKGSGILINISSRASYRGDTENFGAYAASKGGLTALTKSVARDFGKKGIVAYTIAPGFIDTDMAHEAKQVYGEAYLMKDVALNQLTPPDEVGKMVSFLAKGSVLHMTGATLHINAGSYMI